MALIDIDWRPSRRRLRGFGTIAAVVFAALGAWVYFRHSVVGIALTPRAAALTAGVLWAVAALALVLRFAAPVALRPLYVALSLISWPIGWVLSHVLLAVLFYGVVTPMGLLRRAVGGDPLTRQFPTDASTYWIRRRPAKDTSQYFRQF